MSFISFCSSVAIVVGLGGIAPQIVCMLRSRSSAGQSALGWTLGVGVHLLMVYVNLAGHGATLLAAGSALSATLAGAALALVVRFRGGDPAVAPPAGQPAAELPPPVTLGDLPTRELAILRAHVAVEHERRLARRRRPALV